MIMSKFKPLIFSLLSIVLFFVIPFIFLELGLRIVHGVSIIPGENFFASRIALLKSNSVFYTYDSELGWINKPNYKNDQSYTFGNYGIRLNGENAIAGTDILAVGDSFTLGAEVADDETWPSQLSRRLNLGIVNGGVGAYGLDQTVLRAHQLMRVFLPKIVIVSSIPDDIMRSAYSSFAGANKPYFRIENGELARKNSPVPRYSGTTLEIGPLRAILGRSYLVDWVMRRIGNSEWWLTPGLGYVRIGDYGDTEAASVDCRLLQELKQEANVHGTRIIFVMQYGGGQIFGWPEVLPYVTTVLDCANAAKIETIDLWAEMKAIQKREPETARSFYVMHGDEFGHMNRAGNGFVAEALARKLAQ